MCIIIDTNVLAPVFVNTNVHHWKYKPVFDWIIEGDGFIVYGGTKCKREIGAKYYKLILELKKKNKAFTIDTKKVDEAMGLIEEKTRGLDCDDQHIIAILIVSGCKLVCSEDSRADKFLKNKSLYPKRFKLPSIYRGLIARGLLVRKNIVKLRNCV